MDRNNSCNGKAEMRQYLTGQNCDRVAAPMPSAGADFISGTPCTMSLATTRSALAETRGQMTSALMKCPSSTRASNLSGVGPSTRPDNPAAASGSDTRGDAATISDFTTDPAFRAWAELRALAGKPLLKRLLGQP